MSKNKNKTHDDFEAQLKSEVPIFDGVATGVLKLDNGKFQIVKVEIDVKNLKAGEVTVLDTADHKAEAVEKFKINVVKLGVI